MDFNENGIEMENELESELEKVPVEKESRYKDFDASVKHVFVLTMAGKPVWARYGVEEQTSALMGILFTLFSIVEENNDQIGEIELGQGRRMVFYVADPLILVSIGFGTSGQMRDELTIVRDQILSLMSGGEIKRRYASNSSFDLRRFIAGSERFIHSICDSIDSDPAFFLQSYNLVPFAHSRRDTIGSILSSCYDPKKGLAFSMLCLDSRILCTCQDKYIPEFHPIDILLLINLIKNQKSLKDSEVWLPVCLPRLEEGHSLQAHISYIDEDNRVCLILVSRDRSPESFHAMQDCRTAIVQKLTKKKMFEHLSKPSEDYTVSDVGITGLKNFIYLSNSSRQMTLPCEGLEDSNHMARYRSLYSILSSGSEGSSGSVKLLYRVNSQAVTIAWRTKNFHLFTTFAPLTGRKTAIQAITKLLHWLRKREPELLATKNYRY